MENLENDIKIDDEAQKPPPVKEIAKTKKKTPWTIEECDARINKQNLIIERAKGEIEKLEAKKNGIILKTAEDLKLLDMIADPDKLEKLKHLLSSQNLN